MARQRLLPGPVGAMLGVIGYGGNDKVIPKSSKASRLYIKYNYMVTLNSSNYKNHKWVIFKAAQYSRLSFNKKAPEIPGLPKSMFKISSRSVRHT